jgi:signal transduction histidine kinase
VRPPEETIRRHFGSSAKVALSATLVIIVVYAAVVTLLDVLVTNHLTAQVDRQLTSRLSSARLRVPSLATQEPDSPGTGVRYGLGIYGEPIYVWEILPDRTVAQPSSEAPQLPSLSWPDPGAGGRSATISGTHYRLLSVAYRGGMLVAGESLAELTHVDSVLVASELEAAPALLVAIFLASLLIGLRSAKPIELARRRQLEFTSDASHELRTPLAVIEAELSLARESAGPAEPETLERISEESDRLKHIVEDLLWLARFDSAPPPPVSGSVDVSRIVGVCAERFKPLAEKRSVDLVFEPLGTERATIIAPAEWIDRLASVLVDNACKYASEPGAVVVRVSRVDQRVTLSVEDSGPGIPPEERGRLFDRFRRGTDRARGHGLGLAIADSIVRSTGGRWRVAEASDSIGGAHMEVSWSAATRPGSSGERAGAPDRT